MSKEKKIFQLEKKEICITSSQIKQAIDLLVNENEILQEEIERLNSIIKEVREYIEYQLENLDFEEDTKAKMLGAMVLVLLDKENNNV